MGLQYNTRAFAETAKGKKKKKSGPNMKKLVVGGVLLGAGLGGNKFGNLLKTSDSGKSVLNNVGKQDRIRVIKNNAGNAANNIANLRRNKDNKKEFISDKSNDRIGRKKGALIGAGVALGAGVAYAAYQKADRYILARVNESGARMAPKKVITDSAVRISTNYFRKKGEKVTILGPFNQERATQVLESEYSKYVSGK